ncbi:leucine-rich repeat-containing protein 74A-like [Dysidea avara]|uniref:leucine-rich repeat-containing protein 74A-like n=1 Tax=Dysidea avara TaxID=196820 RepID=UPI00332BA964
MSAVFKVILECKTFRTSIGSATDNEGVTAAYLTVLEPVKDISINRSCQIQNITNTNSLIFVSQRNSLSLFSSAAEFFTRFSRLAEVTVVGITVKLEAVDVITNALHSNLGSLEKVVLSNCKLNSQTLGRIVSSLQKSNLKVMDLSHNEIKISAVDPICQLVKENDVLVEINLSHNGMGSEEAKRITCGLKNCRNLHSLNLSNNQITDDAAKELKRMALQLFKFKLRREHLDLTNNPLSSITGLKRCVIS